MNEFEWRRQLRQLRQPKMPERDLWPAIETTLGDAGAPRARATDVAPAPRPRWLLGTALAASLVLAGGVGWHTLHTPTAATTSVAKSTWKPADPRLAGAAIELDAAHMELELALRQAPDSAALQRLLRRTEQQQTQLQQLANRAS